MGRMEDANGPRVADSLERLNRIYLTVISRYKDYIEENESLSVAELPTLVTPKNPAVVKKIDEIKSHFGRFDYDANFHDASMGAFTFVKNEIEHVTLPIQFWLTPEETLAFLMGDVFDRNVLLCSVLIGLGNPSCKIFVMIKNEARKIFVYYEFRNSIYLLDLNGEMKKFRTKDEMLVSFKIDEETIAYEFNDRTYSDIK